MKISYLRRFPIDTLKIDQSFFNQMKGNSDDANILCAVIVMLKGLMQRVLQ